MLKKLTHNFLSKGVVALINLYILLLSSRYLGPESRGEIGIFLLNIALIQLVAETYTGFSIVHFLSRFNFNKIVRDGVFTCILISIAGTLFTFIISRQVPSSSTAAWLATVLVLLNTFMMILLLGLKNFKVFNALSVLQPLVLALTLTFLIFVKRDFTFNAFYFSLTISFGFSFLLAAILLTYNEKEIHSSYQYKAVISKGLKFQTSLLLFVFINRYNYYVLDSHKLVGLYNVACTLMDGILLFAYAAGNITLALTSNASSQNQIKFVFSLARICFFISLFVCVLIFVLPDSLFVYLLGPSYAGISEVMRMYAPAVVFQSVLIVFSNFLTGMGHQNLILRAYVPASILVVVASPILVAWLGINGSALAAVAGFTLAFVILLLSVSNLVGKHFFELFRISALKNDFKEISLTQILH